ncbi:MAG: hypothetical protein WCX31_04495 [Salinivirgaceae bacterium]
MDMKQHSITGSFKIKKGRVEIQLLLKGWKDDDSNVHFLYSPALDLTGYGNSINEAKESFEYMLNDFVDYSKKKKTIYKELERLGWSINIRKKRSMAPDVEDLLQENETFRDLQNKKGVHDFENVYGLEFA